MHRTCMPKAISVKERKVEPRKSRDILCSWARRLDIVKMSILTKLIYRVNIKPSRISCKFNKLIWKCQCTFIFKGTGGKRAFKPQLSRKWKLTPVVNVTYHNHQGILLNNVISLCLAWLNLNKFFSWHNLLIRHYQQKHVKRQSLLCKFKSGTLRGLLKIQ